MDAIAGRINLLNFISLIGGVFFGRCSEICGANHTFIPITVESVDPSFFFFWVFCNR